jgi:hypothetical protein
MPHTPLHPYDPVSVAEIKSTQPPQASEKELPDASPSERAKALASRLKSTGRGVMVLEGWKGMIALAGMIALTATLLLSLPGALAMVIWNAVIHETFSGPSIAFHQGVLLGLMGMITFHLVFRPRYLNIAFEHGE